MTTDAVKVSDEMVTDLKRRVEQFGRFELPGQPIAMHMGTSYLIGDLWRALTAALAVRPEPEGMELETTAEDRERWKIRADDAGRLARDFARLKAERDAAVETEREACAALADEWGEIFVTPERTYMSKLIARTIRARGGNG